MTTEKKHPISSAEVADYLLNNKDFFHKHCSLLAELSLFQNNGQIIPLAEKHIERLKKENVQLKRENGQLNAQLNEFIEIANENEALTIKINQLILSLIDTKSLQEIFSVLYNELCKSFQTDRVAVRIFAKARKKSNYSGIEFCGRDHQKTKLFDKILKSKKATCVNMTIQQQEFLFGNGINNTASSVIIPLHTGNWQGILSIGSLDPDRFQKDMQFDLLMHMVAILNFIIDPWITNT